MLVPPHQTTTTDLCRRWVVVWPKLPMWDPTRRYDLFRAIWGVFYSTRDAANGSISTPMSMVKCRNAVLREFR